MGLGLLDWRAMSLREQPSSRRFPNAEMAEAVFRLSLVPRRHDLLALVYWKSEKLLADGA